MACDKPLGAAHHRIRRFAAYFTEACHVGASLRGAVVLSDNRRAIHVQAPVINAGGLRIVQFTRLKIEVARRTLPG
jgi:hypothetical protein